MRKIIVLSIVCVCCLSTFAQELKNLDDCYEYALKTNLEIKDKEFDYKLSDLEFKNEKRQFLPSIYINNINGISHTHQPISEDKNDSHYIYGNASINVSMPLWSASVQRINIKNKQLINSYNLHSLHVKELEIKIEITAKYFSCLIANEGYNIAKIDVEKQEKIEEQSKKLFAIGKISTKDMNDAKINLLQAKESLLEMKNIADKAKLELANYLAIDTTHISFSSDFFVDENQSDDFIAIAINRNSQIKAQETIVEYSKNEIKSSRRNLLPSITLNYEASTAVQYHKGIDNIKFEKQKYDNFQNNLYLSIQIPIFDRLSAVSAIKEKKIKIEKEINNLEQNKLSLKNELTLLYQNVCQLLNEYKQKSETLTLLEQQYDFAEKCYLLGQMTSYELNTYRDQLNSSKVKLAQSKYEILYKQKLIEIYTKE